MNKLLIITSVLFSSASQIFLKLGMIRVGKLKLQADSILQALPKMICNLYLIAGCFSFALSLMLWLVVLSKNSVSNAYPFISIGYLIISIFGYFFLNEPFSTVKIIGLTVIIAGLIIFSQG